MKGDRTQTDPLISTEKVVDEIFVICFLSFCTSYLLKNLIKVFSLRKQHPEIRKCERKRCFELKRIKRCLFSIISCML